VETEMHYRSHQENAKREHLGLRIPWIPKKYFMKCDFKL